MDRGVESLKHSSLVIKLKTRRTEIESSFGPQSCYSGLSPRRKKEGKNIHLIETELCVSVYKVLLCPWNPCIFMTPWVVGGCFRSVPQSWPTLYDPMDCGPPGSFVHGIFQAGILEWVASGESYATSQVRKMRPWKVQDPGITQFIAESARHRPSHGLSQLPHCCSFQKASPKRDHGHR